MASILVDSSQASSGFLHKEACLAQAINKVVDVEFVPLFDEIWRCFNSQSYNAAFVWTWCAVSCYMRAVVRNLGEDIFAFQYGQKYKSLSDIKDGEFIETCRDMGILQLREDSNVYDWITSLRDRRNGLAHGTWKDQDGNSRSATPEEVLGVVCLAVDTFFKAPIDGHQLAIETARLKAFAATHKKLVSEERAKTLIEAVGDKGSMLAFCYDLLTIYRTTEGVENYENVKRLWRAAFESLDEPESVVQRVLKESAHAFGMKAIFSDQDRVWGFDRIADAVSDRLAALDLLVLLSGFELSPSHRNGAKKLNNLITELSF